MIIGRECGNSVVHYSIYIWWTETTLDFQLSFYVKLQPVCRSRTVSGIKGRTLKIRTSRRVGVGLGGRDRLRLPLPFEIAFDSTGREPFTELFAGGFGYG
jgi:hypothetical protein